VFFRTIEGISSVRGAPGNKVSFYTMNQRGLAKDH
jgi:hypothetical protein